MGKTTIGYLCFFPMSNRPLIGAVERMSIWGKVTPPLKLGDSQHSHIFPRVGEDSFQRTWTGLLWEEILK